MTGILCVAGSPVELRRLEALAKELRALSLRVRLGWIGPTVAARGQGTLDARCDVPESAPWSQFVAAAEGLLRTRPDAVVVAGAGAAARAVALAASGQALAVVRLDAGTRNHTGDQSDAAARAVDHLAALWLCTTAQQADNLRREGMRWDRVHTVGSALVQSLRGVTATGDRRIVAWLDGADPALEAALFAVTEARQCRWEPCRGDWGDVDAIAGASAVVTDCDDAQEVACALRVPCVTVRPSTARPETVDCGANQVAGPDAAAAARALAIALDGRHDWRVPYVPGAAAAAAAIAAFVAAPTPDRTPPPVRLPSDADWTGRTLGFEECELAVRAIRSGTLNSTKGTFVARFEQEFAGAAGRAHAIACASGSAAVHCAIAALGLRPGDEVVTTPITDMGALTPILYEGGLPVFADVDPRTLNVTAATLEAQLTDRTRAVVVTHLFGLPCEMAAILALARRRGLVVVEDMAQALGSEEQSGRPGTFGALACYSLQQGKHMTTGEGGVVTTDDPDLARRVRLFVNKAWGYGDSVPDHYFPALNYRLTELQGAVALAQLRKLDWVVARRREVAARLGEALQKTPGLQLPGDPPGGRHSWWKYAFLVDPDVVEGGSVQLGARMQGRGVSCLPRYIQKPAFECQVFQDLRSSPVSALPLEHNPRRSQPQPLFVRRDYPGAVRALERVVVLPINELYTEAHVQYVAQVIAGEAKVLAHA